VNRRLFFALWPPQATAEALARWAAPLARETRGQLTRVETIHLTLAFLGSVPEARIEAACVAAGRLRFAAFAFRLEQTRYWKHNRIVWAGASRLPAELPRLAESLARELRGEGFKLEDREFVAHVTLLRRAGTPAALPPLPPLEWPVSEFLLVRSRPPADGSATGSLYEILERFACS